MGWVPTAPPKCPACAKAAYPAESIILLDRAPYHKRCIKCCNCDGRLTMGQIHENQGQLFCKNCYQTLFNPQYFSSLAYNGGLSQDDRQRIMNERQSRESRPLPPQQFNGAPRAGGAGGHEVDGSSPSVQPLPFPFQPGAPPGAPGAAGSQNSACANLFMSDVHVGELMTIAPQDPIMATGL